MKLVEVYFGIFRFVFLFRRQLHSWQGICETRKTKTSEAQLCAKQDDTQETLTEKPSSSGGNDPKNMEPMRIEKRLHIPKQNDPQKQRKRTQKYDTQETTKEKRIHIPE